MDSFFEISPNLADGVSPSAKVVLILLAFNVVCQIASGLSRLGDWICLQAAIVYNASAAIEAVVVAGIVGVGSVTPDLPATPPPNAPAPSARYDSTNLKYSVQAEAAAPCFASNRSRPYYWEKPGWAPERDLPVFPDITETQRADVYKYLDTRLTTTQTRALRQNEREEATAAALREFSADRAKETVPAPPTQIPRASFLVPDPDYEAAHVRFSATFGVGGFNSISASQSKARLPGYLHADLSGIYVQESEPVVFQHIFEALLPAPPGTVELTYDSSKQNLGNGAAGGYTTTTTILLPPVENVRSRPVQSPPPPGPPAPAPIPPVVPAAPAGPAAPSNSGSVVGDSVAQPTRSNRLMQMSITDAQIEVDNIMTEVFERINAIREDPQGAGPAWKKAMASQASRAKIFALKHDIINICEWAEGPNGRVDENKLPRSKWDDCMLDASSLNDLNLYLFNGHSHEPRLSELLRAADRLEKLFQ